MLAKACGHNRERDISRRTRVWDNYSDLLNGTDGAQFANQLAIFVSLSLCQPHEEIIKVHNTVGLRISCMEDEVGPTEKQSANVHGTCTYLSPDVV